MSSILSEDCNLRFSLSRFVNGSDLVSSSFWFGARIWMSSILSEVCISWFSLSQFMNCSDSISNSVWFILQIWMSSVLSEVCDSIWASSQIVLIQLVIQSDSVHGSEWVLFCLKFVIHVSVWDGSWIVQTVTVVSQKQRGIVGLFTHLIFKNSSMFFESENVSCVNL